MTVPPWSIPDGATTMSAFFRAVRLSLQPLTSLTPFMALMKAFGVLMESGLSRLIWLTAFAIPSTMILALILLDFIT